MTRDLLLVALGIAAATALFGVVARAQLQAEQGTLVPDGEQRREEIPPLQAGLRRVSVQSAIGESTPSRAPRVAAGPS